MTITVYHIMTKVLACILSILPMSIPLLTKEGLGEVVDWVSEKTIAVAIRFFDRSLFGLLIYPLS